ncbi:hypothetical protein J4E83_009717 [Alternaria metachromatica]|uniref:uncharacterized protein n=1 Tax=Alternaria metachromatica TaxID=283354 RepID=UPI0020C2B2A1|nr:uncharacterized protein J4E83_009717 [Alternaria metachromatica]KAI4607261.1 hypothetical protein J4E83_009717 [Alternaria metachromatica]
MPVAKTNLAQLYTEIGDVSLLDHAPYDQIVTASQYYDPRAISFKIRFGYIVDKYSKRPQEIWVLFYPPTKEGRHPEMQFHSFDPDTNAFTKHDDSNISTTVSALASAFNNPKKAAKGKHVALAKYYYLKALVSREAGGASELEIPIPITRTFVDSLRVVCREFEEAKERSSRSPSVTLVDDHDSVLSDPPEDLLEPTQPVKASSMVTAEVSSNLTPDVNIQRLETLLAVCDDERELQASNSALDTEKKALEQRCRVNKEKQAELNARRELVLKGMSLMDAFKLGGQMEREEKRRKLA